MSAIPNALPADFQLLWYRISRVLGHGGFGITYLALDTNLEQAVAIKEYLPGSIATRGPDHQVLPLTPDHEPDYRWGLERFISEGRTLARFDHPAIVRVLSVFEAHGTAYLVMRFERGQTLGAELKEKKTLPEERVRAVIDTCMDGLETVHEAGFIHRDIQPANIYLRDDGHAVLIDFGSARQALSEHTQTLTTLVSPGYAPFEQYQSDGKQQGPWTDIYALAATAYRCVTGIAPMAAVDRGRGILENEGDPLVGCSELASGDYSPNLLAAIDAGLSFHGDARPQNIAAWRATLRGEQPVAEMRTPLADPAEVETVVADTVRLSPQNEPKPPAPARKKSWYRRKRVWLAVAVVFLLLAGEDKKENDPDDITPPSTAATGSVNEPVESEVEKVPEPASAVTSTAPGVKPPVAEVPVLPSPRDPAVDEPVGSQRDLAARFETAVVAGDYGTAEALIDAAIEQGANSVAVEHARQSIAAHRELTEVIALLQARPDLMRGKRVKTALDKAAKAMDSGRPQAAFAIAKRLRKEFERAARRRRK
ncbi:MAG: protein kinase [Gammaproteobacteria bacterium]|nr:protein kinase [Gammaproteobacteria bacterium]